MGIWVLDKQLVFRFPSSTGGKTMDYIVAARELAYLVGFLYDLAAEMRAEGLVERARRIEEKTRLAECVLPEDLRRPSQEEGMLIAYPVFLGRRVRPRRRKLHVPYPTKKLGEAGYSLCGQVEIQKRDGVTVSLEDSRLCRLCSQRWLTLLKEGLIQEAPGQATQEVN